MWASDLVDLIAEPGEPCLGAVHVARLDQLPDSVPVWTPASTKFTDAWSCGSTPVVMFDDIQVSYEVGWSDIDVDQKWADMARDFGGEVQQILGRPAYVHPADNEGPRNSVSVVVDGVLIRVIAMADVPIDRLVDLTTSITLPKNLQR